MSLNIKNAVTHRLVRELAAATGLSQTAAVEDAVRRRLADLAHDSDTQHITQQHRLEHARAIAAAYAADLSAEDRARIARAEDDLYDQDGLPR